MRLFVSASFLASVMVQLWSCTTLSKSSADAVAGASPPGELVSGKDDLPPELRDANKFDPAATLDADAVKNSDFYEVQQKAEADRAALDAAWKEQDAKDEAMRKAQDDEERKRLDEQRKADAAKEQTRNESRSAYQKSMARRERDRRDAERAVGKMPTISHKDVMWNGLEE